MSGDRCEHFDLIGNPAPRTNGCEECLALGLNWTALRVCMSCGHVGCCEDSPQAHALAHFNATGHPIIRPLERGKGWTWCYPHHRYYDPLPAPAANETSYGATAKWLHWLVFVLVFAQFVVAIAMPDIHRDTVPETLINLHMSIGALILVVIAVRILWRIGHPVPLASADMPAWERSVARVTHVLLYLLLAAGPLLGWAAASARDWKITLFGAIPLPHLVPAQSRIGFAAGDAHVLIAWTLLALIGLHAAAALYHRFIRHDRVLQRMLPGRSP